MSHDELYQPYQIEIAKKKGNFLDAFLWASNLAAVLKVYPQVSFEEIRVGIDKLWNRDVKNSFFQLGENEDYDKFVTEWALREIQPLVVCKADPELEKIARGIWEKYWRELREKKGLTPEI